MKRERALDIATIGVLVIAVLVGAVSAWDRFVKPALERRPVRIDSWEQLSRTGHLLGDSTAPVLIVEFVDYQCPGCRLFERRLAAFKAAYPGAVAVRYRHWPLPYHETAYPAARAAECAAVQGRFPAFHQYLMSETGWLDSPEAEFMRIAGEVDIPDSTVFRECVTDVQPSPRIEADIEAARGLGGRGTPTLVINGWLMREMPDSARLADILSQASSPFDTTSRETTVGNDAAKASSRISDSSVNPSVGFHPLKEWRISPTPTLTLGRIEGSPEQTFGYVSGAVQMSNGVIAVVDLSSAQVIMFTPDGSHLRTVGGEGDGPSELRGPSLLHASRYDSLVVAGGRRISVVRADGTIYPAGSYQSRDLPRAVVPGGIIYQRFFDLGVRVSSSSPRVTDVELGLLRLPSEDREVLGRYQYYTTYIDLDGDRQRAYPMPLRSGLSLAPTALGIEVVVGSEGVVRTFEAHGEAWDSVPLPLSPRRVTDDDIELGIEAELARRPPEQHARWRNVLERMPYPEDLPFVERMVPDGAGGAWIQLTAEYVQDGEADWVVVNARGESVARVRVPEELDVFQVGLDYVVATSRDALGVQRVHRYGLVRRGVG